MTLYLSVVVRVPLFALALITILPPIMHFDIQADLIELCLHFFGEQFEEELEKRTEIEEFNNFVVLLNKKTLT